MEIYLSNGIYSLLREGERIPFGAETYSLVFHANMGYSDSLFFPEYELKIVTSGGYGWTSYWKLVYKGKFEFTPSVNNRETFIVKMLNDLRKSGTDYENTILKYIQFYMGNESYLKIKASLNKLTAIEELQLENTRLRNTLQEMAKIQDKLKEETDLCHDLKQQLQQCSSQLNNMQNQMENSLCFKFRKIFKFLGSS